jgi:hypothetical protein
MIAFEDERGNQLYVGRLRRELAELEHGATQAAAE